MSVSPSQNHVPRKDIDESLHVRVPGRCPPRANQPVLQGGRNGTMKSPRAEPDRPVWRTAAPGRVQHLAVSAGYPARFSRRSGLMGRRPAGRRPAAGGMKRCCHPLAYRPRNSTRPLPGGRPYFFGAGFLLYIAPLDLDDKLNWHLRVVCSGAQPLSSSESASCVVSRRLLS